MAERMATNAPIQGTATADIIKIGMKKADEALRNAGLIKEVRLVLQVHDELVYEMDNDVSEEANQIIKDAMEGVLKRSYLYYNTDIPLLVHSGFGSNLGEVK